MFTRGTPQWSLSADVNIGINFCVWALMIDGLQVAPFDVHPPGDGSLQKAGLHAQMWQSWFTEAVIGQRTPANPSLAMIGTPMLQQRLQALWSQYLPIADAWHRSVTRQHRDFGLSQEGNRNLWDALVPFHSRLSSLRVYAVDYPQVVSTVVPPVSLVLGLGHDYQPDELYLEHILRAAEALSRNV